MRQLRQSENILQPLQNYSKTKKAVLKVPLKKFSNNYLGIISISALATVLSFSSSKNTL